MFSTSEADFEHLRNEYVLRVTGLVTKRPEGNENPNLATGEIEVEVSAVEVLNTAAPLPFQIDEHVEVGEEARLRYRYLDLRRPEPGSHHAPAFGREPCGTQPAGRGRLH